MRKLSIYFAIFAVFLGATSSVPSAAGTGEWLESEGVKLRLVSVRHAETGQISAALEAALKPGWKTYWRSPGASGLPLQIDFSRSTNVASAQIHHPTPIIFTQGQARTAGYEGRTIFPVSVTVGNPHADVVLNARGLIGVCEDICIPLQFDLSLTDSYPGATSFSAAETINAGFSRLPKKATQSLGIDRIFWAEQGAGLVVEARLPADTENVSLFLEGPRSWYLEPTRPTAIDNGIARFDVPLPDQAQPSDVGEKGLTATLAVDGVGVEQEGLQIE